MAGAGNVVPLSAKGPLRVTDHKFKVRPVSVVVWLSAATFKCIVPS